MIEIGRWYIGGVMSVGGILFGVRKPEAMNRTATALDESENVKYISDQLH